MIKYVKYFFALYFQRAKIIKLNAEGFDTETRKAPFESFGLYCWPVKDYDSDADYSAKGEFFGHVETEKKHWICWN